MGGILGVSMETGDELVFAEDIEAVASSETMSQRERESLRITQLDGAAFGLAAAICISKAFLELDSRFASALLCYLFLNRVIQNESDAHPESEAPASRVTRPGEAIPIYYIKAHCITAGTFVTCCMASSTSCDWPLQPSIKNSTSFTKGITFARSRFHVYSEEMGKILQGRYRPTTYQSMPTL
jgi:hypothetical protein